MADEDLIDFDQEWFFEELKDDQAGEGTTLDPPLSPAPVASSSTNNHGSTNHSHPQIQQQQQQQLQQPSHQSNAYQEQQMGHRDGMMASTSTYGMQQQHQPLQEQQQQGSVSQHQQQQQQQMQVHHQSQQQFETLQPYNPNQQNQNIQNHYQQQNSQQMVFDVGMDYVSNEASTSSAMPMECRIPQEYNVQQTQQYPPPQQQQGDTQWMSMDQSSQMTQQHPQHMTSVVYTSTSQQMQRIPDPGGHHNINQPQIINNYNPQQNQQIIQTGINGETTILANLQPVQQIQRIISQQPQQQQQQSHQQQQFDNNYIQQPIAYIDHTGSQQFITSQPGEAGNINFHQPIMQVIPQIVPIQSAPPVEAPIPPPPKPKATKNASRANGRKKNQPPPQAPGAGDSVLSKISGSIAVDFNNSPEKAAKMAELVGQLAALGDAPGFDMTEAKNNLLKQLDELLTGANITPQPTQAAPPSRSTPSYPPIAPNSNVASTSTPTPQPKNKKKTKAELKQNLQQKKDANAANANINSNVNMNIPPPHVIQQQQQQQPTQQPPNESGGCRIVSQDANYLIVESNGTLMKAVNVRTENGTATYQILGPVDEKTLYQMKQPPPQLPPPPPPPSQSQQQQQKRIQPIQPSSSFKAENDEVVPAAVSDVVNSLSSSNKPKPQKKTPARSRNKKASEPPQAPAAAAVVEQKQVIKEKEEAKPTVICVPSASKEPPKPKIIFPPIAVSAKRVKDKTESRKKRIAEWIKKFKEVIATTDINSPFTDKEDVFNRLMPYGFHYEPEVSQKTMDKFEHELLRHRTHLYDRYKSIEGKMQQIFIRDTTRQNFDLEKNMLLAIDAEYERQQLEKDKALVQHDPYQFIRESDVLKTPSVNDEYVTETRRLLNLNKPKTFKPTKGFHFEPSHFDEQEFIKRKQKLIEEDEEKERKEKLAAFKKAHPPPPVHKPPPPKPTPPPIQTPKLPSKPAIEPVKINLKLQENTVPLNKEIPILKKPVVFTSSSESSSSDDDYVKKKTLKSKKSKSIRSSSPQKERKSKSPQKSKHTDPSVPKEKITSVPKEKAINSSIDKINNIHQPPIKTTIRKPMPPEFALYPSMNLSNYKIPKIGEQPSSPKSSLPIKPQEPVQKEQPIFIEPKPKEFLKPPEPQKVKENVVETLKIKKSSLSNSMDNIISSHKEKKEKHHHHHRHSSSSKKGERSNSVVSNHSTKSNHKSSENIERSGSLNRETSKVPSLVIKPPPSFKYPSENKTEETRIKEKEKEKSSKDKPLKDTTKAEEKSLKTKIEIPKPEIPKEPVQQPLKLKINFGPKKTVDSPSTSNPTKESIPPPPPPALSDTVTVKEHKKKDKKEKHSIESRKEKKVVEEAPPILEINEEKTNHIDEAAEEEEDKAAKEAKRKRKEEKKRQKAEKKQRKLEKKIKKEEQQESSKEETDVKPIPKIDSPPGDFLKFKFVLKVPPKLVAAEAPPLLPPFSISPPPPQLKQEPAAVETPKLKFTIPRNILPESSKKSKKEKKEKNRNLKRESPKFETEPNLEAPPPKIPRVKIKLGGAPQNLIAASSSSASASSTTTPIAIPSPPKPTTPALEAMVVVAAAEVVPKVEVPEEAAVVEKKKSVVEKQMENSENTASSPLQQQQHPQVDRPSMVGQPPTASIENVTAPPAKIRRLKKSKHGGSGFSDCSDVEETQVDLRLMTDRILSRCRD